jgi:hypothetical protein
MRHENIKSINSKEIADLHYRNADSAFKIILSEK